MKDETEGAGTVGDDTDLEQGTEIFSSDSMSDQTENESKMGLDVFFKVCESLLALWLIVHV